MSGASNRGQALPPTGPREVVEDGLARSVDNPQSACLVAAHHGRVAERADQDVARRDDRGGPTVGAAGCNPHLVLVSAKQENPGASGRDDVDVLDDPATAEIGEEGSLPREQACPGLYDHVRRRRRRWYMPVRTWGGWKRDAEVDHARPVKRVAASTWWCRWSTRRWALPRRPQAACLYDTRWHVIVNADIEVDTCSDAARPPGGHFRADRERSDVRYGVSGFGIGVPGGDGRIVARLKASAHDSGATQSA